MATPEAQIQAEFVQDALRVHNEYRRMHGVPPLNHNQKLCDYAMEWATKLAKENKFQHRPDRVYGENLFTAWSSDPKFKPNAKAAVDSWYNEIKQYTFGVEKAPAGTGHFTQVVWKDTENLGTAFARGKGGKVIAVCNYDPPGNVTNNYVQNVLPAAAPSST